MPAKTNEHCQVLLLFTMLVFFVACGASVDGKEDGGSGDSDCGTAGCRLSASDPAPQDRFGSSVAVSSDVIVVGAERTNDDGSSSGSIYVFRLDGVDATEDQKLTASDGAADRRFGGSVAISGGIIVVGACCAGPGAAYVYRQSAAGWAEEIKLTASDAMTGDEFGGSVAVSGGVIVVGAERNNDNGSLSGSAYVFRFNGTTWVEETKLTALDAAAGDMFGSSVAVSGGVVAVGADGDDDAGSAYAFRFDGSNWMQEAKLAGLPAAAGDAFGGAIAISENVIVVGARHDDGDVQPHIRAGSASVFRFDGTNWVHEKKLIAFNPAGEDFFGTSVSVSGDVIVVGADGDDDDGSNTGSSFVFRFNGTDWDDTQPKPKSPVPEIDDRFGQSVSVSGDVVAAGVAQDSIGGANSGAAYAFEL